MQDDQLIKQAQEGDSASFTLLLEKHYESIFAFAYKWCGHREDAEDVAQQACVKLARTIGQYRFEASFSTWLYRLVINCAKDWQKSQGRHSSNHSEDEAQACPSPGSGQQPEQQILIGQLLQRLDRAAEGMKETALLVCAEGFTHGEAATILGVKESTISWRLHEIRKLLHSMMGGAEE